MILEELRGITREYEGGITALRGVSLRLMEGESLAIVGPNGAGKTTLMRIMALLDRPTGGELLYRGERVSGANAEALRRGVTMVFQRAVLFNATVYKNLAYGLRIRGLPRVEVRARVREALGLVGLEGYEDRPARALSGGEQQMVVVARALALDPELLLLDEPTASLDPRHAAAVERVISGLRGRLTIAHSTQDLSLAVRLSDRVAFLRDGSLVQTGTVEEVIRRPVSEFVARFVGFENVYEGRAAPFQAGVATVDIGGGVGIEAVTDRRGPCKVAIRPEDIAVSRAPLRSSMRNVLRGRVVSVVDAGPMVRITADVGGLPFTALITRRSLLDLGLRKGDPVYLCFKASSVLVI